MAGEREAQERRRYNVSSPPPPPPPPVAVDSIEVHEDGGGGSDPGIPTSERYLQVCPAAGVALQKISAAWGGGGSHSCGPSPAASLGHSGPNAFPEEGGIEAIDELNPWWCNVANEIVLQQVGGHLLIRNLHSPGLCAEAPGPYLTRRSVVD